MTFSFIFNSILLGIGLAMDAFSVSVANALSQAKIKKAKMLAIAGTFAFFQCIMPLIGWVCVHTLVEHFKQFEAYIPYIALALLCFIGTKAIIESVKNAHSQTPVVKELGAATLLVQGIATSIDALSVGFTIEQYSFSLALTASLIIAAVTFSLCLFGLFIGREFGTKFQKAELLGGIILIAIGLEIFIKGVFF